MDEPEPIVKHLNLNHEGWDVSLLEADDLDKEVDEFILCAYQNKMNESALMRGPSNHWAIFLATSADRSVRLDMTPGHCLEGTRGMLTVKSKNFRVSSKAIHTVGFQPKRQTDVKAIMKLLDTKGREMYEFTSQMEGCRHWVHTVVTDLEESGLVESGAASTALESLSMYWKYPPNSGAWASDLRKGEFRQRRRSTVTATAGPLNGCSSPM